MDVRQLGAVVAVVDEGTVTAAADALHVSQPALSQTIRGLEAELGTPLFHRLGRRMVLTPAGEELVGPARQVLRDVETVRARVAAVAGLRRGHLDLVSLPTLAVDPASALVGRFRAAHPEVTVRLAEPENTADLEAMVADGTCEVGITDLEAIPAGLVAVPIAEQRFRAVCPPGTRLGGRGARRRITMAHLADLPIVTTPVGTSTRRLVDQAFADAGLLPVVAVETAQREALLPLVLAGAGATMLPATLADDAARRGAVVADVDPAVTRTVALLHRDGPLSPAAAAFLELAAVEPTG